MQSRDAGAPHIFPSRDVCRERFVSLHERASRALFSRHARHLQAPHPPGDGRALRSFVLAIRDDQSLVCPQRLLGRLLELVLRRALLRFPPSWRGRKHGMALQWAARTSRRTRTGPAGCRRRGDHRYSCRRAADGNRHSSAGLAGSTFESRIIVPARRLYRLHERRGPCAPPKVKLALGRKRHPPTTSPQ
jgi:hypothetical protein